MCGSPRGLPGGRHGRAGQRGRCCWAEQQNAQAHMPGQCPLTAESDCTVALLFCSRSGLNSDMQTLGQARLLTGWFPWWQRPRPTARPWCCSSALAPLGKVASGLSPSRPSHLFAAPMSQWRALAKGPQRASVFLQVRGRHPRTSQPLYPDIPDKLLAFGGVRPGGCCCWIDSRSPGCAPPS